METRTPEERLQRAFEEKAAEHSEKAGDTVSGARTERTERTQTTKTETAEKTESETPDPDGKLNTEGERENVGSTADPVYERHERG